MPKYDVIIIGAGPGGYPCAIRLAQLGKKVLVIEKKEIGGLCLNWGCIPTKALSYAAEMTDTFKKAQRMGFKVTTAGLDMDQLRKWKEMTVKRLRSGVEFLFKSHNIDVIKDFGKLVSEHQVHVGAEQGPVHEAEHIIIATGTEVTALPGIEFDHTSIIDTDDALELKSIPKRMLVIGAGASGLEMATIYARLGSTVTVVEMMEQILPGMESELCASLAKIIQKSGIKVHLGSTVSGIERKNGELAVTIQGKMPAKDVFDTVLVTVGRKPDHSAFADVGLNIDKRGFVVTNDRLQTNLSSVCAIGDITGAPLLAHKATKQGIVLAEIICGVEQRLCVQSIPSCVFTIPPLSSVGLTEAQAREKGYTVKVGRFPFRALGKAVAMGETEGMVKIVGNEDGTVLGLHILGAESPSLIGEGIIAVDHAIKVSDLAASVHPHPTLTEAIAEAAGNFYKKAIHIQNL
jgi:dihydrolipoamide dehydrogenase